MSDTLNRTVNLRTATGIVVANMIGSGVFITSGIIAGMLPSSMWVILCWCVGGLLALLGALCYSELATRMPYEGGEYVYLNKLYHPLFGFLSGWTSFIVGFSAPIAASAIGFSEYLFASLDIDGISNNHLFLLKKSMSISIVIIFTSLHFRGLRKGTAVQNFLVLLKILFILSIIIMGIFFSNPNWENITFSDSNSFTSDDIAIGTAMMLVMFSYSGWNASAYIAGEIINPRRNIVLSLVIGTAIVFLLSLGINLFFFSALPYQEVKETIAIGEASAVEIFGTLAGNVISFIIAIILLSSISAFIMIGPRIYYAMARDKLFFSFAKEIHDKYKVPSKSILIQGGLALIFVLFSSLEQLLVYLYFALNIFPFLAVFGLFIARKRKIGNENAYKVIGYPLTPLIFLTGTFYLAIVAFLNRPIESSAAILTVLIGIPLYYLWIRIRRTNV